MNKCGGRKGVSESYIPGFEEIADDFIKLCTDHILDENNDTSEDFIKDMHPWAAECMFYFLLNIRLGVINGVLLADSSSKSRNHGPGNL